MEATVRWSLKVSRETDAALRAHLGQLGGRKGDLSRFVQEAVRDRLRTTARLARKSPPAARARARAGLALALEEVHARTRGLSQARLEKIVAEAVAYARARR